MSSDPSRLEFERRDIYSPDLLEAAAVVVHALERLRRNPHDRFANADLMVARKRLEKALITDVKGENVARSIGTLESCAFDALWRLVQATDFETAEHALSSLIRSARSMIESREGPEAPAREGKPIPKEGPEAPAAPKDGTQGPVVTVDRPDLVTLNQAAGIVHRSKRTLERYKTRGTLPDPIVEGGGGKPNLYPWPTLRLWLEQEFGIKLPTTFPANRQS